MSLAARLRAELQGVDLQRRLESAAARVGGSPHEVARAVRRRAAERSLHEFVRQAWPLVEGATPFVDNWHVRALCDHFQAWALGLHDFGPDLLVNQPPGTMKSIIASIVLPAWIWGPRHMPEKRFFYATYSQILTFEHSTKCRNIVESAWFQTRWPHARIAPDTNQKGLYATTSGGYRLSTTVNGAATGMHPDFVIVDDPHNPKRAESDAERRAALVWWDGTISTRGQARNVRRAIIMQRLHTDDLSGHALATGGWAHLCLPMRYEHDRMPDTPLGWNDPRTEPGELLWPELFPEDKIAKLERQFEMTGAGRALGQLQQRPPDVNPGAEWPTSWFRPDLIFAEEGEWPAPEHVDFTVIYLDPSMGKTEKSDYSAFVCLTKTLQNSPYEGRLYVEADLDRRDGGTVVDTAIGLTRYWNPAAFGVETNVFQELLADWIEDAVAKSGIRPPIVPMPHYGNKITRIRRLTNLLRAGDFRVKRDRSGELLVKQLRAFPDGDHDDGPDALEGAVQLARLVIQGGTTADDWEDPRVVFDGA